MVENYTWEIYRVEREGETVCLKCAAEAHFSDPENWIDPCEVKYVVLEPDVAIAFRFGKWGAQRGSLPACPRCETAAPDWHSVSRKR